MFFTALAYQNDGHEVHILTNHHDRKRCFPETLNQLSVQEVGSWFPRTLFGKCLAVCAYLRFTLAAFYLILFGWSNNRTRQPDALFLDQISVPLPLLRLFSSFISSQPNFKIIFYGHFPDQLLATDRRSSLKRLYRLPIDWLEQWSNGFAHVLLVNSRFTETVFRKTFKTLKDVQMQVVYPACNFDSIDRLWKQNESQPKNDWPGSDDEEIERLLPSNENETIFVSLNRYERKKNIGLALHALHELIRLHDDERVLLIIAGGYDERVRENVEHFQELQQLATKLQINKQVRFLRSPSDASKVKLLRNCHCVLYTPENEHFGIVPLEAMYCERPVIACASGGPLETVLNEITGFHCESSASDWADKMIKIHQNHSLAKKLGLNGKEHVLKNFAFDSFQRKLNSVLE